MQIVRLKIQNFRGIKSSELFLSNHTVFVGDNNTGKSTVLEAIDLVLGSERLAKHPVIDEHDFYAGEYIDKDGNTISIGVEVVITGLTEEQQRYFKDHLEWWDENTNALIDSPPAEGTDVKNVIAALRLNFKGEYDKEEDDFTGKTFFSSPTREDGGFDIFRTSDKRKCGFLFLRTIRTGSRALSLERGSLLDIILKLQDKKLQMWEDVLVQLRGVSVAENPEIGISGILSDVQESIRTIVPSEWSENPHIRVTDLTRENLRKALTVFMSTGANKNDGVSYAAPFQHQGTGTINTLVLSLLTIIAELKQNVIFAMEEPEIAIPPHTQKRIVNKVKILSSQSLFTSHSPYILEEFEPNQLMVLKRENGVLSGLLASMPPAVKTKAYRTEFRKRFCEALLAKRVLITEGITEWSSFVGIARMLNELYPDEFSTLEALGLAVINAETDSQVEPLGKYFSNLGKDVFAVFDKQEPATKTKIEAVISHVFEAPEKGFENVILKGSSEDALKRFALSLVTNMEWPTHLDPYKPVDTMIIDKIKESLSKYLKWGKGNSVCADFLFQCTRDEMPEYVVNTLKKIKEIIDPKT